MASPELEVSDLAQLVLKSVEDAAFELSVTLPSIHYITSGTAVHDCEQVVVTAASIRPGAPSAGTISSGLPGAATNAPWCEAPWSLVMTAEIVRDCAPTPSSRTGTVPKAKITKAFTDFTSPDAAVLMSAASIIGKKSFLNVDASIRLAGMGGGMSATVLNLVVALGTGE